MKLNLIPIREKLGLETTGFLIGNMMSYGGDVAKNSGDSDADLIEALHFMAGYKAIMETVGEPINQWLIEYFDERYTAPCVMRANNMSCRDLTVILALHPHEILPPGHAIPDRPSGDDQAVVDATLVRGYIAYIRDAAGNTYFSMLDNDHDMGPYEQAEWREFRAAVRLLATAVGYTLTPEEAGGLETDGDYKPDLDDAPPDDE